MLRPSNPELPAYQVIGLNYGKGVRGQRVPISYRVIDPGGRMTALDFETANVFYTGELPGSTHVE